MRNLTSTPRSPKLIPPTPHIHLTFTPYLPRFTTNLTSLHPMSISLSLHFHLTFILGFRFGDCFGRNTRTSRAPWGTNGEISHHKFYLAFGNSIHCNDYISEKFWRNALSSGAVPVVYGQDLNFCLSRLTPLFFHLRPVKNPNKSA